MVGARNATRNRIHTAGEPKRAPLRQRRTTPRHLNATGEQIQHLRRRFHARAARLRSQRTTSPLMNHAEMLASKSDHVDELRIVCGAFRAAPQIISNLLCRIVERGERRRCASAARAHPRKHSATRSSRSAASSCASSIAGAAPHQTQGSPFIGRLIVEKQRLEKRQNSPLPRFRGRDPYDEGVVLLSLSE